MVLKKLILNSLLGLTGVSGRFMLEHGWMLNHLGIASLMT